ncbi:Cell growth-regulating nucleolar protein [Chionoecetes opilio]|uniref:Cell growth-regulating nucleolar protein n=1 Tax=Chionoecetes opilio TaxID=41210 RepID=A0A8J4YI86_CHIOP|nr:Cell growth-regulating nucleolar protein [Chionoecetes opilio]
MWSSRSEACEGQRRGVRFSKLRAKQRDCRVHVCGCAGRRVHSRVLLFPCLQVRMVYFVCATCGTSLKKSQVTSHWFKCRKGKLVSCMDCGKDFWGEDYAGHLKCITENEKYGGNNYVSKENKGEKKQEEWVEKIKEKVATSKHMEPQLRDLLQSIMQHSNIPRKEGKFRNFMKSSCRVSNPKLVDRVWVIFKDANTKDTNTVTDAKNGVSVPEANNNTKKTNGENGDQVVNGAEKDGSDDIAKLNKREKKELRREKQSKKSKKDKHTTQNDGDTKPGAKRKRDVEEEEPVVEPTESKKKKKKKGKDLPAGEEEATEMTEPKRKKKRKEKDALEESIIANENHNILDEDNEDPSPVEPPSAFKWSVAIRRVLQEAPEEGLKVSKVQRKVLSLYCAAHGEAKSKAELLVVLHKKLNKKGKFVLYKDKVRLPKE